MHRCLCLPVDWPQRSLLIAWRVDKSRDTLITVLSLAGAGAIFIWCAPLGRAPQPPIDLETPPAVCEKTRRGFGPELTRSKGKDAINCRPC